MQSTAKDVGRGSNELIQGQSRSAVKGRAEAQSGEGAQVSRHVRSSGHIAEGVTGLPAIYQDSRIPGMHRRKTVITKEEHKIPRTRARSWLTRDPSHSGLQSGPIPMAMDSHSIPRTHRY